MRTRLMTLAAALAALLLGADAAATQAPVAQAPATTLKVTGDVETPLALTEADMKALPRTKVEIKEEGRGVIYEGVSVGEILKKAGIPVGTGMRGKVLASYVIASASDGYQVVFSLGELDQALSNSDIIVADTVDGKPLLADQGPFRLVTPKDSRAARSVRMLDRLDVVRLRK